MFRNTQMSRIIDNYWLYDVISTHIILYYDILWSPWFCRWNSMVFVPTTTCCAGVVCHLCEELRWQDAILDRGRKRLNINIWIWGYYMVYQYIYGIWIYMIIYDYIWLYLIIYDYIWLYMMIYDYIWLYMIICDDIWLYMIIYDYIWLYMIIYNYINHHDVSIYIGDE